jgi:hypothetical protein
MLKFEDLVKQVLFEAVDENSTIKNYIVRLFNTNPDYRQALMGANAEQKFDELITIATGLNKPGQYTVEDQLISNSAFLPVIDFLSQNVYPIQKNINDTVTNAAINDLKTNQANFVTKLQTLEIPNTYIPSNNKILRLTNAKKSLAGMKYQSKTPLNGVIDAVKEMGGYNIREVTDILQYPRKYEIPASIKLNELKAVRDISEALYFFYITRIKTPDYISVIKTIIPELQDQSDEEVENIIDNSIGIQSPQNRKLQDDYIQFLQGNSKILVQLVAGENFSYVISNILQEDVNPSSWKPSAQQQTQTQQTNLNTQQQSGQHYQTQTTQEPQARPLKSTNTPFIRTIGDFNKSGYSGDQNVARAYQTFYNYLTKGTTPSGWQRAGSAFDSILKSLEDIGGTLGNFSR